MTYGLDMARLLACPFCRELFSEDESSTCPHCEIALKPMEELPPSLDAAAEGDVTPPELRRLPVWYAGRGRGPLLALAVLGIVLFFCPWVEMAKPEDTVLSGFDLARGRAGWLWGGAVAWFVMIPLVFSRRRIADMRGVRIICVAFAAMTLVEVGMLIALPPRPHPRLPLEFFFGWGLYGSGLVSLLAIFFGARFGGRLDDIPALPWESERADESSAGQTLH